jgi:hypothetical protein
MEPKKFTAAEIAIARKEANQNILSCATFFQKKKRYHGQGLLLEIVKGLSQNMNDPDLEGKKEFGWTSERRLRREVTSKYASIDFRYEELFKIFEKEVIDGFASKDGRWKGLKDQCGYPESNKVDHNDFKQVLREWDEFKRARNKNIEEIFEDFFLFWIEEYTGKRNGDSNVDFHYHFGLNEKLGQAIREWFRTRITCGLMRQNLVPFKASIFSPGTKSGKEKESKICWDIKIDFYNNKKDLPEKLRTGDFILEHSDFNFSKQDLIEKQEWKDAMSIDWNERDHKKRFKKFIELSKKNPNEDLVYQFKIDE